MKGEKFNLMQYPLNSILSFIDAEDFVIPELQRPFVWNKSMVRDFIDSLYRGYPTGYIITWKNPDIKTRDGGKSSGKRILIDGQQRIKSLMTAIAGHEVVGEDFKKDRIKIAFNPLADDEFKRFAVSDASHLKDKRWIPDISVIFKPDFSSYHFVEEYSENNSIIDKEDKAKLSDIIIKLKEIANRQIGVIELNQELDIDEVTEMFIRINSKGKALSQYDFVMSKMAADSNHEGDIMRKAVDYFCHLAVKPDFYEQFTCDEEFSQTKYAEKLKWLSYGYDNDIYNPDYGDMLRVCFMHQFGRGRLADLVSLLAGRDFETKEFRDDIVDDSYKKLDAGIMNFINEYNFKQFVLAIRSAGFISRRRLPSQTNLNFAYNIFLMLLEDSEINKVDIKRLVQKLLVFATLTERYGSSEATMDKDIRSIKEKGFLKFFKDIEASILSDSYWEVSLPLKLDSSSVNSPAFNVFLAAQVNLTANSLLMDGFKVSDLIKTAGDIHHIFPKTYLKSNGIESKSKYNQVANYIYLESQVNKAISKDAPNVYFGKVIRDFGTDNPEIGNLKTYEQLKQNLKENAIPEDIVTMTVDDYDSFLVERRKLMANLIKEYYMKL